MTSEKNVSDYLKDVVSSIDKKDIDELTFARRKFFDIKPSDPSYFINSEDRYENTKNLTQIASLFWIEDNVTEKIEDLKILPCPEITEWHQQLKNLLPHRTKLLELFEKNKKEFAVIVFFKDYLTKSSSEAVRLKREMLKKAQHNKILAKKFNTILKKVNKIAPDCISVHGQDLRIPTSGFKLFSKGDSPKSEESSGWNGWVIFVVVYILIRLISRLAS